MGVGKGGSLNTAAWKADQQPQIKNQQQVLTHLRAQCDNDGGNVEGGDLKLLCYRFPQLECGSGENQKYANILRTGVGSGNNEPDRQQVSLCEYLHEKHNDLWLRHVIPREGGGVAGGMQFRVGDDFVALWKATKDWDDQFSKPKNNKWFCHAIRLMARYQAYYAFGIINWWPGTTVSECKSKHRARQLTGSASADDDSDMVMPYKIWAAKNIPLRDYTPPRMPIDPILEAQFRLPSNTVRRGGGEGGGGLGGGGEGGDDGGGGGADGGTMHCTTLYTS